MRDMTNTIVTGASVAEVGEDTLNVRTTVSKSTDYAKEKHEVSASTTVSLPDRCVIRDNFGGFSVSPEWTQAIRQVAQEILNLQTVVVAGQIGCTAEADASGVMRVVGLFGGGAVAPAPAPAPTAPAAAPAAAPFAAPVAPASTFALPGAAPMVQAPFQAAPAGGGGGRNKSTNPNAWSNQTIPQKVAISTAINTHGDSNGATVPAGLTYYAEGQYGPNWKVGEVRVSAKVVGHNSEGLFSPATVALAAAQQAAWEQANPGQGQ